jgi:hypothetical protein
MIAEIRRNEMKRLVLFFTFAALVCAAPSVKAEQKYSLGFGNLAVKVDYFRFMDSDLENLSLENGVYVGLEGYASLFHPNMYFGMETGWARTEGDIRSVIPIFRADLTADYVPIEFNAKYVIDLHPCLKMDLGAGVSMNYFNLEVERFGFSASEDDWLVGGQFFTDVNYMFPGANFFAGVNLKYQITEDLKLANTRTDTNADNLRVGAQVGYHF